MQPIAAADVSAELTQIAIQSPQNATREIAGPEAAGMDEFVRRYLTWRQDPRIVISPPEARYFGAMVDDRSLVPSNQAVIGRTSLEDWFSWLPV